jgi:hypothetical protein
VRRISRGTAWKLSARGGDAKHFPDLHAHPLVGGDHVRLDHDHHVLFEREAVPVATRGAARAKKWGVDAAHRAVDEVVADREAGLVDRLGDVEDRIARRPRTDRVARAVVDQRGHRMHLRILRRWVGATAIVRRTCP